MTPAGRVRVARDAVPLTVRIELDVDAAAALGWPKAVLVARAGDVLTIAPDPDGRPTWVLRACRGLGVTTRIPVPPAMLGRWTAALDGGALTIDTAGPDLGRRAA